jgi:hypothetical protein
MFAKIAGHRLRTVNGGGGIRNPYESPRDLPISAKSGAKSGALAPVFDPDLAVIVASWPTLPSPIKAAILALVDTAGDGETGEL